MLKRKPHPGPDDQFESDVVISQASKIVSNFRHLRLKKTSEQELFLLSTARIEIKRSEVPYIKKEFLSYEINFYLSAADYGSIENVIPSIRKNLKLKAKIVFQWFPQCVVEDIRVLVLQA